MERTCKKCGETKPIEEFKKDNTCTLGYSHTCRSCYLIYKKQYYQDNKQGIIKLYNENNKERHKQYMRRYYPKNKDKFQYHYKYRPYGASQKKYVRKNVDQITDKYLIKVIHQKYGIARDIIALNPEFIEIQRKRIIEIRIINQLKQSLKILQNETSTN